MSAKISQELKEFQFYDSPIKSSIKCVCSSQYPGFNSMIVRLKERPQDIDLSQMNGFQFYDSPIKRVDGKGGAPL